MKRNEQKQQNEEVENELGVGKSNSLVVTVMLLARCGSIDSKLGEGDEAS